MLPQEHLQLKHVLQTVCVLESVVLRSFGPDGGQVLFTRDTGQAMLSRSGTRILTALRLEHPVARFVVECVCKHSTATGDGSKSFVFLLASFLRTIHAAATMEPNVSRSYNSKEAAETATARHLADKLLAFASEDLNELILTEVAPYGCCVSWKDFTARPQSSTHPNNLYVRKLLASFFHTRLSYVHCDFISDLAFELLHRWRLKDNLPSFPPQFINDNFDALHTPVSGFPISASRLIGGQVIHRDFATQPPPTHYQPIKAVIFTGYLQPKVLNKGDILEVGRDALGGKSIVDFNTWMERSQGCVIANLQTFDISVVLSAVKQSAATLSFASQAGICFVECVSEEELSVFAQLSRAAPVSDCWMIEAHNVATLEFCRPIQLGAHRYVHVDFHVSEVIAKPCSLVICAPGEGQTDQYTCAFRDAIRMLLTTWEPMTMTSNTTASSTLESHQCTSEHIYSQIESTTHQACTTTPFHKLVLEPGCLIPAGGTFEFLLHHALVKHSHKCSVSSPLQAVSQLLANALLSIPRHIHSPSRRRFLQTQTGVVSFVSNHPHPLHFMSESEHHPSPIQSDGPPEEGKRSSHCYKTGDMPPKDWMLESGLESVSCKYRLLLAVLQCLTSLLRVDMIIRTHNVSHTLSRRVTNASLEDTEDEAED